MRLLFESLRYVMLLSRSSRLTTEDIKRKKRKLVVAERRLLRKVHNRENIEMRW